jgi:hypothetical protein
MNGDELANPVKYLGGEEFFILGGLTKRELIAAMAMQGLLSDPEESGVYATVADVAVRYADALIERLSADPVAEGVNLLPMYSRELDEELTDEPDRGVSR